MLMLVPVLVWNSAVASPIELPVPPPMPNLIVPGLLLASAISSPTGGGGAAAHADLDRAGFGFGEGNQPAHGFHAEIVPPHQDHRAGEDFGHRRKLPQIDRVVRMNRLGDQRTRRDEIERVAVSG